MARATNDNFWESTRVRAATLGSAVLITLVMLFGNLGGIGVWEPWEANEITVAQEYATRGEAQPVADPLATSWNDAVVTFGERPVDRSLLKTMLVAAAVGDSEVAATDIGALERRARLPLAVMTALLALALLAWINRRFGAVSAAVSTVVFVTSPAIYLGTHNLAAEMLFVVTTSLALLAFVELMLATSRARWGWGIAYGVLLAAVVLDQRMLGFYLVVWVVGMFAVSEVLLDEAVRQRDGPGAPRRFGAFELAGAAICAVGCLTAGWWAWQLRGTGDKGATPVWVLQYLTLIVGSLAPLGMLWFARKSRPGRAFWSAPGLVGTAIGVVTAIVLARTYSAANPILLDHGDVFGEVRVLAYMLSNHLFETSIVDSHLTFDVAVRQVGFSLFPWVALVPLAFVYLSGASSSVDGSAEVASDDNLVRRFLLVWIVGASVVLALGSGWDHYFYPAYAPFAAAIGLALTDATFWRRLRATPMTQAAIGFVAITIVLMLGKDLERFPSRFIETYLGLQEGFEFPEDFSWGELYKPFKYLTIAMLAAYFFGLVSWAVLAVRRLKTAPQLWRALRERRWDDLFSDHQDPLVERTEAKEALREGGSLVGRIASVVERPRSYALILSAFLTVVAASFLFAFIPNATNHLSQRGVFETFTQHAKPGEKLWRYQVSSRDNSVYLADVETIPGAAQFATMFDGEERFFAVIPRGKLAAINHEVRRRYKRNLYVLDARSSRLLLTTNKLLDGEIDRSFVNDKIVEGEPDIDFPVTFESGGETKHPVFDGQLELLGYSLDHAPGADGMVSYKWGETMTITYFFRVLKRVPSSQKIFLHVDYPGTRINGDHTPNNGEFTTNYWLEGDVVKAVQPLVIESYSTPGEYSLNFGFFVGSKRMKVEPREAHDGRDRITLGKIRVQGL